MRFKYIIDGAKFIASNVKREGEDIEQVLGKMLPSAADFPAAFHKIFCC